jgi:hypothetical protein
LSADAAEALLQFAERIRAGIVKADTLPAAQSRVYEMLRLRVKIAPDRERGYAGAQEPLQRGAGGPDRATQWRAPPLDRARVAVRADRRLQDQVVGCHRNSLRSARSRRPG